MQSTHFFHEALERLKRELRHTEDQEVAETLGMTKAAFSARKARGSFPDKELIALVAKRPELGIDYDFVISGVRAQHFDAAIKQAGRSPLITSDERLQGLIDQLRPESRAALLQTALRLRELELLLTDARQLQPDDRYPERVETPPIALHDKPVRKRV